MKYFWILLMISIVSGCKKNILISDHKINYHVDKLSSVKPIPFKPNLTPSNKLIHRGVLTPELNEYYYTLSNKDFTQFDVYVIQLANGRWSEPKMASFNSPYDDHGQSFSSDGKSLYFSSTRPVEDQTIQSTWHIWKSTKADGIWSDPQFINIPNLKGRLVSHPTVTDKGKLYFHVSNLDYSGMDLYYANLLNGSYQEAQKVNFQNSSKTLKCTPFISPKEDFILFAEVGKQLDIMISFNDGNDGWTTPKRLGDPINSNGQGNPYLSPDHNYLFYATGSNEESKWSINWVDVKSLFKNRMKIK